MRKSLLTIVFTFALYFSASQSVFAAIGPTGRGPDPENIGTKSMDYTVYRTVNTLSCHPQNVTLGAIPNLTKGEVPLMIAYHPTRDFGATVKGFCVGVHFPEAPEWFGQTPSATGRPKVEWRHYVVMEFPNPCYGVTTTTSACPAGSSQFAGKYIHWEGKVWNYVSSISSLTRETWHFKNNTYGRISVFNTNFTFGVSTYAGPNGTSQKTLKFDDIGAGNINTCASGNTRRSGDTGLPCINYNAGLLRDAAIGPGGVSWNPTHYTDIPHNKYGHPVGTDRSWVKCSNQLPAGYFDIDMTADRGFGTTNPPPVFPVQPAGCEYPALTGNPGAAPLCLDQSQFSAATIIPQSMEACTSTTAPSLPAPTVTFTPTPTITPTRVPTVTPTPTTAQTSPTPTYLRSDFTGGPGGAKDGRVTIQDLTQLYSEFYKTDLPTLKANIATQCPGTTQCQTATIVDIQDYNIFTTDWRAYLETL